MTTPNINRLLRALPVNSARGAPMGARSRLDDAELPLYVQALAMVDGDYSTDGTYWGCASLLHGRMYCGFSADLVNLVYVRATSRHAAIKAIELDFGDATFYRR